MRSKLLLALVGSLLSLADAIHLIERDGPAAVLQLSTKRKNIESPIARDRVRRGLQKRTSTLQATLDNEETLYFANVTLGTPAQSLRLDIDTGSSDLWVNSASSSFCEESGDPCAGSGTYNANDSSTYEYVNSAFYIKYADGSAAEGDFATDTLNIDGTEVTGMQFGIGYTSSSQQGILGIGYRANEVAVSTTGKEYSNFPQHLVDSNTIKSNAYSLWLNDLDANEGSILFGGVDTDKYHGSLESVPIIQEDGEYREFIIALTAITANGKSISTSPIGVLLDSGSSLSYLPDALASSVYSAFGAEYSSKTGLAQISCDSANSGETLDLSFSGATISVALSELVLVAAVEHGQSVCILGISPAGSSTSVLGDTFLRSAYVVYDLANNQISLAATNFNSTSSNIQEIGTGSSAVPDATLISTAVSTVAVSTGGARAGGIPSTTGLSNSAAMPTAAPLPWGIAAMAGAGVLMAM